MFDWEDLRNQNLIEEREIYENSFFIIEDIKKSDEMDYYSCPQYEDYISSTYEVDIFSYKEYIEEFDLEIDFDDYLIKLRDEELIKQREFYEREYGAEIIEEPLEFDALDILANSYEEYPVPDFSDYDFFEDDYYFEEINMDAAYCGNHLFGYVVDDNESFEEFDYPEGPDENLCGFKFPEPDYLDDQYFDFPDDIYDYPEPDYDDKFYDFEYYENVISCNSDDPNMQKLIDEHIAEEKEFLGFLASVEIPEEYYPPEIRNGGILIIN